MGQSATREPGISPYQHLNLVSFITAHVMHGWAGVVWIKAVSVQSRHGRVHGDLQQHLHVWKTDHLCNRWRTQQRWLFTHRLFTVLCAINERQEHLIDCASLDWLYSEKETIKGGNQPKLDICSLTKLPPSSEWDRKQFMADTDLYPYNSTENEGFCCTVKTLNPVMWYCLTQALQRSMKLRTAEVQLKEMH